MVLFTFVIMLLNAGEEERTRGITAAYFAGIPGAAGHLLACHLRYSFMHERAARLRQLGWRLTNGHIQHAGDQPRAVH